MDKFNRKDVKDVLFRGKQTYEKLALQLILQDLGIESAKIQITTSIDGNSLTPSEIHYLIERLLNNE